MVGIISLSGDESMRVLVTGATGFAGSHLVEQLLESDHTVFGLIHPTSGHLPWPENERFLPIQGDLLDLNSLRAAFERSEPEQIYHLAGQASPGLSWRDPAGTIAVNTGGTANMLEAAREMGRPRVLIVTSAHVFGRVSGDGEPLTEETQAAPADPYGVSKLAAAFLAPLYWQRYDLPVVEARPFNHIGPRQAPGFVVPDFASQVAAVKLGLVEPEIRVGNLDVERDFTDVRDIARAYRALAERGEPGESYLVCSGETVSVRWLLETLIELSGCEVKVIVDPELVRPAESPRIVGSYEKIKHHTGWTPTINLRQSLQETLIDWVDRHSR
jgi:GDP-4-dehydro-6-deoxy-D-mannose reductase